METTAIATLPFREINRTETLPINCLVQQHLYYVENVKEESPDTTKSRRSYLRDFLAYFESMDITSITNSHIDAYFLFLRTRVSPLTHKEISEGSLNNRKRAVRVFLRWCSDNRDIPLKVKIDEIFIRRETDEHKQIIDFDDIVYVIKRITNRQDRLIVRVFYEAGLRIAELAKLKIEHIHGRKVEVIGKGRKRRITFISLELAEELHDWMVDRGWYTGYVFRPQNRKRVTACYTHLDSIRRRIQKWFRKILGIEMKPHQLRHAFARKLLFGGCSLRAIQKMLGHASIETTMVYLDVDESWIEGEYLRSVHHNNPHDQGVL